MQESEKEPNVARMTPKELAARLQERLQDLYGFHGTDSTLFAAAQGAGRY